jgi:hypothetical protein
MNAGARDERLIWLPCTRLNGLHIYERGMTSDEHGDGEEIRVELSGQFTSVAPGGGRMRWGAIRGERLIEMERAIQAETTRTDGMIEGKVPVSRR